MKNKLGLRGIEFIEAERKIVSLKMTLLPQYFTFNKNIFELNFLRELHKFLFFEIYCDSQIKTRPFLKEEEEKIKFMLETIKNICINRPDMLDEILKPIHDIWNLQPFYDGNTRTMIAYLSVLNNIFHLNLNIDLSKKIESNPIMFKKENFVNQKRLTKN